jgi:hypothetical protein
VQKVFGRPSHKLHEALKSKYNNKGRVVLGQSRRRGEVASVVFARRPSRGDYFESGVQEFPRRYINVLLPVVVSSAFGIVVHV